jgi:hypothetical protein
MQEGAKRMLRGEGKVLLAVFFVLLFLTPPVSARYTADFFAVDFEPKVVQPGESYTLNVTLKNLGSRQALYVRVEFNPNGTSPIYAIGPMKLQVSAPSPAEEPAPFSYVAKEGDSYRTVTETYFGIIRQEEEIRLSYPIYVQRNTSEGVYPTPLRFLWSEETVFERGEDSVYLNFFVEQPDPALEVEKEVPTFVRSEETFEVDLEIVNTGRTALKNLDVNVSSTNFSAIQSLTPNNFHFEDIAPRRSLPLSLTFITNKNTPTGLYAIPVTLTYESYGGFRKEQTEILSIMVRGFATLDVGAVSTDPIRVEAGKPFTLTVRIENVEEAKAKAVKAWIDLPFLGNHEAFIGELKRDDDAPAIFLLEAGEAGVYPYNLTLSYLDDTGTHQRSESMTLVVYPPRNRSPLFLLFLGAAGGGALLLYWRRKKP